MSVVVPNYNHATFLADAVDALCAQSWPPFEIIVIDDGSTDHGTQVLEMLERRLPELRTIHNTRNEGVIRAMNQGLAVASGEYVYFGAADDLVLPGFFDAAMRVLAAYPKAGLCSGLSTLIDPSGAEVGRFRVSPPRYRSGFFPPEIVRRQLARRGSWFMGNTTIYQCEALRQQGGFRTPLGGFCDGFATLVIGLSTGVCFLPRHCSAWRRMPGGEASRTSTDLERARRILAHARGLLESDYSQLVDRAFLEAWESRWRFGVCAAALASPDGATTAELATFEPGLTRLPVRGLDRLRRSGSAGRMLALLLAYGTLRPWEGLLLPVRRVIDAVSRWRMRQGCARPRDQRLSKRRVLTVIIGRLDSGGAERQLLSVLPGLVLLGWSVRVVTLSGDGELADAMRKRGVCVRARRTLVLSNHLPRIARRGLAVPHTLLYLWRELRGSETTILNFQLPEAYLLGMGVTLLGQIPGRRVMSRRSQNHYQQKYPFVSRVEGWLHRRLDLAVANSQAVWTELLEEGLAPECIEIVHNGVDVRRFDRSASRRAVRAALGLEETSFVAVVVANLIPYKGHQTLLDSMSVARENLPPRWHLLCVGRDDGMGEDLRAHAYRLGLQEHVRWLGGRADIPDLLAASDLGVLASLEEGLPNAVLEYMAARLPVVATAVGGTADLVVPGVTGLLVPPQDAGALAQAIATLARDPEARRAMGTAGRTRVEETFDFQACVDAYDRLFGALIPGHPPDDINHIEPTGQRRGRPACLR